MKTIKHNNKTINISAPAERALHEINACNGVVAASDLAEGNGKRTHYAVDFDTLPGVDSTWRNYAELIRDKKNGFAKNIPLKVINAAKDRPRVKTWVWANGPTVRIICEKLKQMEA